MCPWYTNPSWWEAIGTIGATLVALYLYVLIKHFNRPIIDVLCGNEEPYCRPAKEIIDSSWRVSYFVRLKIKNMGKSLAQNCEGKLNKIYDPITKINHTPFDPVVLNWVGHDKGPININSGEHDYLDLLKTHVHDIHKISIIAEDMTPRGIEFHPDMKDWIFEVSIYGENIKSVSKSYKFTRSDIFTGVKIEELMS